MKNAFQSVRQEYDERGATGFDREVKGQEGMPGLLLTRKQVELNITADSHEYALAA